MVGIVIWFVLIIWVVYTVTKNKKSQTGSQRSGTGIGKQGQTARMAGVGARPNQSGQSYTGTGARQNQSSQGYTGVGVRPNQSSQGYKGAGAATGTAGSSAGSWNWEKQQELKERLYQKYRKPQENNILKRAIASAEEDFSRDGGEKLRQTEAKNTAVESRREMPVQEMPAQDTAFGKGIEAGTSFAAPESRSAFEPGNLEAEEGELLRRVEDLMVKGPDLELAFSRDFVAEGIEMLSRIG